MPRPDKLKLGTFVYTFGFHPRRGCTRTATCAAPTTSAT